MESDPTLTEQIQDAVRDGVDFFIPLVEGVGATIIVAGVVIAASMYVLSELRIRCIAYEHVRLTLGRFIALGLEFQLAADILSTAVAPSYDELGKLGAIAAIRTVLNFFLAREIEKAEEMEKAGMLTGPGDMPEPKAA